MKKRYALFILEIFLCLGTTKAASASTFTQTTNQGSVQAQSLIGIWRSVNDINGKKVDVFFTFTESTFTMNNVFSINEPRLGIITFSILIPGNYILKNNELVIKSKANKGELKIENIEFVGEVAEKIRQKPELEKQIIAMLEKKIMKTKASFSADSQTTVKYL